jgi:hypothetical protein
MTAETLKCSCFDVWGMPVRFSTCTDHSVRLGNENVCGQTSIVMIRTLHKRRMTYGVSKRWSTLMHSDEIYSELKSLKSSDGNYH